MELQEILNSVIQNGFMTVFASTVLYFLIKFANAWYELKFGKNTNKLLNDLVVIHVRAVAWYHARGQLRTLESILVENNIDTRKEEVTRKIRNAVEERCTIYWDYFNTLQTNINRLGDFYANVFDMEGFLKQITVIILKPYSKELHGSEIAIKLKDLSEIFYEYLEEANIKVEEELYRLTKQ